MPFKLSLNALKDTIAVYTKLLEELRVQIDECRYAVICLTNDVYEGKAMNEFYQAYQDWHKEAMGFVQKLTIICNTLTNLCHKAETLQLQYAAIPQTVGAETFSGDIIYYEEENFGVNTLVAESFWQAITRTIPALKANGLDMKFKRLYLPSADKVAGEAKNAYKQVSSFMSAFKEYVTGVKRFEEEATIQFKNFDTI